MLFINFSTLLSHKTRDKNVFIKFYKMSRALTHICGDIECHRREKEDFHFTNKINNKQQL